MGSMACEEVPLISAAAMRSAGQNLLDALAEEDRLYQPDLPDEDFKQWQAARAVAEQLAIDYTALVHLYLEAVRMDVRKAALQ
jgi:hypothetical protein